MGILKRDKNHRRGRLHPKKAPVDTELARLRAEVIERMKESRASAEKLLEIHEQEKAKLTNAYQRRRVLQSRANFPL